MGRRWDVSYVLSAGVLSFELWNGRDEADVLTVLLTQFWVLDLCVLGLNTLG